MYWDFVKKGMKKRMSPLSKGYFENLKDFILFEGENPVKMLLKTVRLCANILHINQIFSYFTHFLGQNIYSVR